jgi:hypothetical protein
MAMQFAKNLWNQLTEEDREKITAEANRLRITPLDLLIRWISEAAAQAITKGTQP